MTTVRRLTWGALAVAAAAWAGVVVATRRPVAVVGTFEDGAAKPAAPVIDSDPAVTEDATERGPVPAEPACEGDLPADQLDKGDATLHVRLRGDTDGLPVEMQARLWRLGVPENDAWTAGDEIRATLGAGKDGVVVDRLPRGRYRLECLDRRHGAEEPPEFVLSEGTNERVVAVSNRRWSRLRLLLADEAGAPILGSVREPSWSSSSDWSGLGSEPPEWATPRRSRSSDAKQFPEYGHREWDSVGGPPGTLVGATEDGFFDLGRTQEASAWHRETWSAVFRTDARSGVSVYVDQTIRTDTTFVGVAARRDVVLARVVDSDGSRLDPVTAKIELRCTAVRCAWTPPADAWRTVPVHAKIVKPGCEPLEFDWTAATADAPHALVAGPRRDGK